MKKLLCLVGMVAALLTAGCGEDKEANPSAGDGDSQSKANPAPAPAPAPAPGPVAPPAPAETVQELAQEFMGQLDELAEALNAVSDVATARKAAEVAPAAAMNFKSVAQRLEKLPVPSEVVRTKINAEIETRQQEMESSLGGQEEFLNSLPAAARPIIENAIREFFNSMNDIAPVTAKYFSVEIDTPPPPPPPDPNAPPVPLAPDPPEPSAPAPTPSAPTAAPGSSPGQE